MTKANEILRKAQGAVRLKVRKCGVPDDVTKTMTSQDSIKLNNTTGGSFCLALCEEVGGAGFSKFWQGSYSFINTILV